MRSEAIGLAVFALLLAGCADMEAGGQTADALECSGGEPSDVSLLDDGTAGNPNDGGYPGTDCGKHGGDEHLNPPPGQAKK